MKKLIILCFILSGCNSSIEYTNKKIEAEIFFKEGVAYESTHPNATMKEINEQFRIVFVQKD